MVQGTNSFILTFQMYALFLSLLFSYFTSLSNCEIGVSWPASDPYVLSVGATSGIETWKDVSTPTPIEVVSSCGVHNYYDTGIKEPFSTSGSGFSAYFSRPSYQDDVASQYISWMKSERSNGNSILPDPGVFNSNNRSEGLF